MNIYNFKSLKKNIVSLLALCICLGASTYAFAAPANNSSLEVTIYNDNLALIKDTRIMEIPLGVTTLTFDNISNLITSETVTFKSLTNPDNVKLLEQNYEYDLVNEIKLMSKFLGEYIIVVTTEGRAYSGYLLSNSTGNIILSSGPDGTGKVTILQRTDIQSVHYPSLPEGLIIRPTLSWIINNTSSAKTHEVIVTYLTKGLSWKCDYVGILSEDDKYIDITSWVTLTNNTDMTFENTNLKLIAGDVNQVTQAIDDLVFRYNYAAAPSMAAGSFEEKSFADYHLYTMLHTTTIKSNQTKQVELFSANKVHVKKTYEFSNYNTNVKAYIEFENKELNDLGIPMPKGTFRVSKADTDGSLEFIGEDSIDHTAKDESVKLLLGNVFDVIVTRTLINRTSLGSSSYEDTYEIVIKNHKNTAIDITVIENMSRANWTILDSDFKHENINAYSFKFTQKVDANDSITIRYTVRLQ